MADYTLSAKITADASQFNKEFGDTQSKLQKMGGGMTKLGKGLTKGLTVPILGVAAASVKTSMDFESSMSNVAALSGATGSDLEMLEKKAREMGATTKYSAKNHWHTVKKLAA